MEKKSSFLGIYGWPPLTNRSKAFKNPDFGFGFLCVAPPASCGKCMAASCLHFWTPHAFNFQAWRFCSWHCEKYMDIYGWWWYLASSGKSSIDIWSTTICLLVIKGKQNATASCTVLRGPRRKANMFSFTATAVLACRNGTWAAQTRTWENQTTRRLYCSRSTNFLISRSIHTN